MNYREFQKLFPNEERAIKYFIEVRYNGKVTCNHCGSSDKVYKRSESMKTYSCNSCDNSFSVFKGTIFEKSDTNLVIWFYVINLFLNAKKGISGYQVQRDTGVTYKTAWRMLNKIRSAMGNVEDREFFNTIVEMDETYVGGKPRKGNDRADKDDDTPPTNKRGRGTNKTPVVGVLDRDNKQVYSRVAAPNKEGKSLTGKQLLGILNRVCKSGNIVFTDEFKGYNILNKTNHLHFKIDHTKMFVDGVVHTNNIESFWATLKRGILGIYHKVSRKYLQDYVNEFCFRYNNRDENMFDMVLNQAVVKR